MMMAWKVLGPERRAYHGGKGTWPEPGEWLRVDGEIVPCERGLHLCAREHLVSWIGPCIWTVEYEGDVIDAGDTLVVSAARLVEPVTAWTERTARLFAADCAERVLPFFERERPEDLRPRNAIAAARAYALGEIDAAAMAAASAAARDAARAAAWDAAWAAARDAARASAWDAASAAARSAARASASASAWDAARDAARSAARDAAWAAARDAARASAWDAASAAAWDAERAWQTERLFQYLTGELS